MTPNIRKSLVAIQILTAFFTLLMFAAGLFGIKATEKIEEQQRKPFELKFDEKMRPSIGKPYTEERHYKLLELMRTSDEADAAFNKTLTAASKMMCNFGGLIALSALTSIVLLVRNPRSSKQVENDNLP